MRFETKYNIGDRVFAYYDGVFYDTYIEDVSIKTATTWIPQESIPVIEYRIKTADLYGWVREHVVFATKEEMIKEIQITKVSK